MFPNPRTFSMICAHLKCSLWNGHSSCIARCTSRIAYCANSDFRNHGGNMNCPSRIPTCWCTFLNCKWFSKVQVTSQFSFSIFVFFGRPRRWIHNDTYPAEEHFTPNVVNTTKTVYVPVSMVCTHPKGSRFFHFFFQKWLRAFWKSVELSSSAKLSQPVRTQLLRIFHPSRVAFPGWFLKDRFRE